VSSGRPSPSTVRAAQGSVITQPVSVVIPEAPPEKRKQAMFDATHDDEGRELDEPVAPYRARKAAEMANAMLVDVSRCIGCRACQVACKQWNDLPAEDTHNWGSYQNPPALSAKTWTLIDFKEIQEGGKLSWVFLKRQCMHCEHPACASACPVAALVKLENGAVVYRDKICIGCRYCMMACPFRIPKFEWDKPLPLIRKCTFCTDRLAAGLEPACAKACPTGAITFGERDSLIELAEARIENRPNKYVNHVYGKLEAGGTSVLYISSLPFDKLGLPTLGSEPIPHLSEGVMGTTPGLVAAGLAMLSAMHWIMRRRARALSDDTSEQGLEV
jgi:formate dehydrogenase iron-sulfur subunit